MTLSIRYLKTPIITSGWERATVYSSTTKQGTGLFPGRLSSTILHCPPLIGSGSYMIIQDRASGYWIGTQNGLYRINLKKSTVEVFQKELDSSHRLSANLVYYLLEDSDGLVWIATVGGLDVYNPVNHKIMHYKKAEKGLSDDFIITLCEDSKKADLDRDRHLRECV